MADAADISLSSATLEGLTVNSSAHTSAADLKIVHPLRTDDDPDGARPHNRWRPRLRATPPRRDGLVPLNEIGFDHWQVLADRAVEPNGYYLPDWEAAVNAASPGRGNALALTAWGHHGDDQGAAAAQLIGLMPAISAWRAYRIPVTALVSADPYGTLGTPLLDQDAAQDAARRMMHQARDAGMRALILRDVPLDGAVVAAFTRELGTAGLIPHVLRSYTRAGLDATRDADELLREAFGPKKLKELRRQRHRLADHGDVVFDVARRPADVERALDVFLALEASGWKARRGTAMAQSEGDALFLRRAATALSARRQCEIITLTAGETPVAAGVVLRHRDRAFWFKLGIDERFAKMSPGVQLALELTRHLCADPEIAFADSTASPDHPMIDPIWRKHFSLGDVLIPLRADDPLVEVLRVAIVLRQRCRNTLRRMVHAAQALRR